MSITTAHYETSAITPAMEAGLSDHAWTIQELVEMGEAALPKPAKRGLYKERNSN